MPELTISLTISYDDADDLRKISELLRVADKALDAYAQEQITRHDERQKLLDDSLSRIERPNGYDKRIMAEHKQAQAWIQARDKASHIVYGAYWLVTKEMQKLMGMQP